jgi:hypothetical protein
MNEGTFYRLPKDVVKTELFVARIKLNVFTDRVTSGNDVDPKELDAIIKKLKDVSSHIKKFSNASDVIGTVYEAEVSESSNLMESFEAFLNESKQPVNDATIKMHINQFKTSDDPLEVATEIGKLYGWSPKEIEKAEEIIRKKYIK